MEELSAARMIVVDSDKRSWCMNRAFSHLVTWSTRPGQLVAAVGGDWG